MSFLLFSQTQARDMCDFSLQQHSTKTQNITRYQRSFSTELLLLRKGQPLRKNIIKIQNCLGSNEYKGAPEGIVCPKCRQQGNALSKKNYK